MIMDLLGRSPGESASGTVIDRWGGVGAAARGSRAAALDAFLAPLLPPAEGVALVAVGGLGRREQAPFSDVDLMLVHRDGAGVADVAERLWYPIWDARLRLDHSVRTVPEALLAARDDPRVALGLLDTRHLAGDARLAAGLACAAADQWRRRAAATLPWLYARTRQRHAVHGDLSRCHADLTPVIDLKASAGGLRDVVALRGVGYAAAAGAARQRQDRSDVLPVAVRAAHGRLLDVRDALHLSVGRRTDRLSVPQIDEVAARLGLVDRDALLIRVATDARTVADALERAWATSGRCGT